MSRQQAIFSASDVLMAGSADALPSVGCGSFKEAPLQQGRVTTQICTNEVFIALTPAETAGNGAPRKLQHKVLVPGDLVLHVPHVGGSGANSSGASGVGVDGSSGGGSCGAGTSWAGSGSGAAGSSAAAGSSDGEAGGSVRRYTLSAVVFHCGHSHDSGHYVAVRKLPSGTAWALLDDNRVSAIIATDVMDKSAAGTPEERESLKQMQTWHALAYFYTASAV
jgi:hypothetical protein